MTMAQYLSTVAVWMLLGAALMALLLVPQIVEEPPPMPVEISVEIPPQRIEITWVKDNSELDSLLGLMEEYQ